MENKREHWGSNWGFLMAAIGSAIGLGNIWKFPYVTGMNGGGAFVLVYLICICLIGLPIMMCELTMGRNTQKNPLDAFLALSPYRSRLADIIGGFFIIIGITLLAFNSYGYGIMFLSVGALTVKYGWGVAGMFNGIIGIYLITGVYSVVGGWTIAYAVKAFSGQLFFTREAESLGVFNSLLYGSDIWGLGLTLICQMVFIIICSMVVLGGVRAGIERYSKILMPILFGLLLLLILRGITLPGAAKGIQFFLSPDFSRLSARSVIEAVGHAFYTLSLGMGIIITYGSYMDKKQSIVKNALAIVGFDTLAAIMGGLAIFPAVFAMGFRPDSGPGLVFKILPATFNSMPGGIGWLWSGLFFIVLGIAAITSGVSLIEVTTSVYIDRFKMKRPLAVLATALPIAVIGFFCAVSVDNYQRLPLLGEWLAGIFGENHGSLFNIIDVFTNNYLLPLSGMAIAIFTGWVWGTNHALKEIRKSGGSMLDANIFVLLSGLYGDGRYSDTPNRLFTFAMLWGIFIRFVSPLGILIAFLHLIGVISFN